VVLVPVLLLVEVVEELGELLTLGDDEEVVGVVVEELDAIPVDPGVEAGLVEAWF
jgi:hypothetical protein